MTKRDILRHVSKTMLVVYLVVGVISLPFVKWREVVWHAQAATLSRLQPPYYDLIYFSDGKAPFDRRQIQAFRLFFTELLKILPGRPDAYGMLGFCEYTLGHTSKAITNYKRALNAAPYFFWFNYDLGVIYFQQGSYKQAVEYLGRAIGSDTNAILKFILASKVYLDAATSISGLNQQLPARLTGGYSDSYKLLVLSYFKLNLLKEMIVVADTAVNQKLDADGFFYYYLGVGAFNTGQYERAALYFREALSRNPQSPEAYYYLALTLKALNKEDLAVPALRSAQMLEQTKGPSYETIKDLRLRIF